jgi:hypothetical protein
MLEIVNQILINIYKNFILIPHLTPLLIKSILIVIKFLLHKKGHFFIKIQEHK